ncbi:MAG: ArsR family transcriptional regulator [Deltaproteobacteria bacterium]|nr:ArsR family transcriptional regulator [Deltaproteobacteria bacterium]
MVERVTPEEAYRKAKAGEILLVCGYDDDAQFKEMQLEGAISYKEFEAKLPALPKDQEIVFYCG